MDILKKKNSDPYFISESDTRPHWPEIWLPPYFLRGCVFLNSATDQYSSSVKTWISNIDFLKINVISPLRRLAQHNLISLIKFCATLTCVLNVGTHSRWGLFFDHLASFNYFFSLRISTVVCSLHTHSNTDAFVKNSLYLFLPTLSYC